MTQFTKTIRAAALGAALGLGTVTLAGAPALAAQEVNIVDGYAVHGYDVVAYFTEGEPTEGKDAFTAEYQGATYRFANAEHRDMFVADPAKYAPKYGGYCAYGAAQGVKADGIPEAWTIVDGTLYLNLSEPVKERWEENIPGYVRGADHNWEIIQSIPAEELVKSTPEGVTVGAQ